MKVYVCYEIIDGNPYDEKKIRHVFFYREDADEWVKASSYYSERGYVEMKIE